MIDSLIQADKSLFLYFNGIHNPFFDKIMWIITQSWTWIPLYIAIIVHISVRYKRQAILIVFFAIVSVILSDLVSVYLFKEVFCRLRPSHNPEFEGIVHIINGYKGGYYGFISSHAANSFSVAVFTLLVVRRKWFSVSIIAWACIFSYSRIYVGVHYPADLTVGALTGAAIASAMYIILKNTTKIKFISDRNS